LSDKKNDNPKKTEEEQEASTPPPTETQKETAPEGNELSQLRADVDHLSDDLQSTVGELKKSIVDIRSAVSEIENPFNLLRTISSEKDVKKLNGERMPPGVKSLILGNAQENIIADEAAEQPKAPEAKPEPVQKPETQSPQAAPTPPKTETPPHAPQTDTHPQGQSPPTKANAAYIDWVWNLLDSGLKASDIHQLACSCELIGYMPQQTSDFIYSLAVAAEKLREKGLTKGHLLLSLYKAAAISKANMGWEDMETLIAVTETQLKRAKPAKGAT
jgi:hypothetical protein